MSYAEVSVVVDGAEEEFTTFYDETLMRDYIKRIEEEAKGDGYPTQVFIQYHEHAPSEEECACVQYAQDHKPAYSWNTETES